MHGIYLNIYDMLFLFQLREELQGSSNKLQSLEGNVTEAELIISEVRDQSLIIPSRGLEDIQRGHQKFWAMKGGPLKLSSLIKGTMKTTKLI